MNVPVRQRTWWYLAGSGAGIIGGVGVLAYGPDAPGMAQLIILIGAVLLSGGGYQAVRLTRRKEAGDS